MSRTEFIDDLKVLQEESEECGVLEERLLFALWLSDAQNQESIWHDCTVCDGRGKRKDYENEWDCWSCHGLGGRFY